MNANLPAVQSDVATIMEVIGRAASDPAVNVDKMERLFTMAKEFKAQAAEQAFDVAMALAQAEMEPIRADARNPQSRNRYASYAVLDSAVRPLYSKHGFALSFDTSDAKVESDIRILCHVSCGGHKRIHHVDMPADGKGAKGGEVMTRTHAVGSAITYGKRYLLDMIFNLAIIKDDDGNAAGATISRAAQAKKKPPSPDMQEEFSPYFIATPKGMDPHEWARLYIAAVEKVTNGEEMGALESANEKTIGAIHARHGSIYQTIEAAMDKRRTELGLRVEMKPQDTKQTKKPPAPSEPPHDEDGVIIPVDDPEAFRAWADGLLATATADNLEAMFNEKIDIHLEKLFPPDREDIISLYRKHERRVAP